MGRKIVTEFETTPRLWSAVFDNYDGAPDSHHPMGFGQTELSAVADLLEQDRERSELRADPVFSQALRAMRGW